MTGCWLIRFALLPALARLQASTTHEEVNTQSDPSLAGALLDAHATKVETEGASRDGTASPG